MYSREQTVYGHISLFICTQYRIKLFENEYTHRFETNRTLLYKFQVASHLPYYMRETRHTRYAFLPLIMIKMTP